VYGAKQSEKKDFLLKMLQINTEELKTYFVQRNNMLCGKSFIQQISLHGDRNKICRTTSSVDQKENNKNLN
jgi:hypothetical protein